MPRIIIDLDEKDHAFVAEKAKTTGQSPADWLRSVVVDGLLSSSRRCLDGDAAGGSPSRRTLRPVSVFVPGV